jgi:hypothetical protein
LAHPSRLSVAFLALFLAATSASAADKRQLPDYDGRGGEPVTVGDVLLWVPRVLLVPPYLVSEYIIRRPLGAAIAGAERAGWPAAIYDFFTFGPDHNAGFAPTGFVDFGFRPSVGLMVFWNDAGARGNDMRLQVGFWGATWLAASFTDRIHFSCDPADVIEFRVAGLRRPDYAYFGLGSSSRQSDLVRYGSDRLEAGASVDKRLWRLSTVHGAITSRQVEFHRGSLRNDAVLDDVVARGAIAPPPGYPGGYTLVKSELAISLDSRQPRPASGSGARFEVHGAHSADVRGHGGWVGYGGSAGAFLDVNGRSRVLSLSGLVHFVDPLGSEAIPFTELAVLGGFGPMRGFYPGRLIGRSAVVGELGYRWPIWIWLDGSMRFEVGNVFDEHLRGFELGRLRMSAALGVESAGLSDNPLEILFGFGSETFESGAKIDSLRLVVGTHRGF